MMKGLGLIQPWPQTAPHLCLWEGGREMWQVHVCDPWPLGCWWVVQSWGFLLVIQSPHLCWISGAWFGDPDVCAWQET